MVRFIGFTQRCRYRGRLFTTIQISLENFISRRAVSRLRRYEIYLRFGQTTSRWVVMRGKPSQKYRDIGTRGIIGGCKS